MGPINEALSRATGQDSGPGRPRSPEGAISETLPDRPERGRRSDLTRAVTLAVPVLAGVILLTYSTLPTEERTPRLAAAENPNAAVRSEAPGQAGRDKAEGMTTEGAAGRPRGPAWPEQPRLRWARPTRSPSGWEDSSAAPIRPAPPVGGGLAPGDGQGREPPATQFKLGGILQSADGTRAVVNGRMVIVGDEIDGAQVVSISTSRVVLEKDGSRIVLRVP